MLKEIRERRSIRKYEERAVENDKLEMVLESCRLAPSGSNTQPWRLIVVRDEEMRQRIAEASHHQDWMTKAPVHIVCVADPGSREAVTTGYRFDENSPDFVLKQIIRDTTIGVDHMTLEAESLGLGTCWVAWFEQEDIRPVLGIPEDKYVLCVLTLGYPAETPKQRPRMKMEEIVRYEKW